MAQRVPGGSRRRVRLRRVGGLLVLLLTGLLVATPYTVSHESMEPTLDPGIVVLVDRVSPRLLGYHRGDLIVFTPPINEPDKAFIKRVIGLPGDDIRIEHGIVFVDGERLVEPYVTAAGNDEYEVRVPANGLVVLGDNRTASYDSRLFGIVPEASVVGRVWAGFEPPGDVRLGTALSAAPRLAPPAEAAPGPASH